MKYKIIGVKENVGLIELGGDLEVPKSVELLRVAENLFSMGVKDILIHLVETQFMSHVAVGVIATISRSAHARKGKLTILYDHEKVFTLLDNMGLAKYIDFPSNMEDALSSFANNYHLNVSDRARI